MTRKTPIALSVAAALSASIFQSAPAFAQQAVLEEVIVTASRRSESIQDIPLNISAISGDVLQDQRLESLTEIARTVPGLTFRDEGSRVSTNNIIVRGLNTSNSGPSSESPYSSSLVATYMGEIPLYVDLRTKDLERVEVLIGPQGTLYGSGTLAGAIRYIPNKPDFNEFSGEVRGDLYQIDEADDLSYGTGITLNIPVTDNFALRANVDYNDDSGFIDYNYVVRESGVSNPEPDFNNPADVAANLRQVEDADNSEVTTARIAARWQPTDSFDATLSYWYQDYDSGGRTLTHEDAMAHLTDIGDYTSALRYEEPLERTTDLTSLEMIVDLGFAELTSATGYSTIDEEGQRDQTNLLLDFEYGYEEFPTFSSFTKETVDYKNFVQELRLVSQNDGGFNWIVGAFYNQVEIETVSSEFTPGFDQFAVDNFGGVQLRPDSLEYLELGDNERTEQALFGEVKYEWNAFVATLGARYFEYDEDAVGGFGLPLADTVYGGAPQDSKNVGLGRNKVDDDGTLFKINLAYTVNDDVLTYFTISEGYRTGGINPIPECTGNEIGSGQALCANSDEVLIEPDETTNYELGMRSTWLDQRLTLNAAVYLVEWDKIQVAGTTQNGGLPILVNGGEAESSGLELSFRGLLTDSLTGWGNYSYTKAELTEDAPGIMRDDDDALDGDRLPGSPEHSAALGLEWVFSLGTDTELVLDYAGYYTGDILTTIGQRGNSAIADRDGNTMPNGWGDKLDSYWLHNAAATIVWNDLRAQLFVDNLANEDAQTSSRTDPSELRDIGSNNFALRSYGQYLTQPRTIGMRVTYQF
jgi:iron complex outermembrane recepter protein